MATIKHISSKNADYGAAEEYLRYEHDERTGKPILAEDGSLVPREKVLVETMLCGEEDYAIACMKANLRYQKNLTRDEVKSHHYILSFDPRDRTECGLTEEKALELGKEYCQRNFPGHQAILGVHGDGHNGSGNIHVHIIINSLRIAPVPHKAYMDRKCDTLPGYKHRCTAAAFRHFRSDVMELCQREQLHQVDLVSGKGKKVSDREYKAARSGQAKLDEQNRIRELVGEPVKRTVFETTKEQMRHVIGTALAYSIDLKDFREKLAVEGIELRESRGRFSYLPRGRTKPITARRLGAEFDRTAVLDRLEKNLLRELHGRPKPRDGAIRQSFRSQMEYAAKAAENRNLGRLVDKEKARAKGQGYLQWATIHNLQTGVDALNRFHRYGFKSMEHLEAAIGKALTDDRTTYRELVQIRAVLEKYFGYYAASRRKEVEIPHVERGSR